MKRTVCAVGVAALCLTWVAPPAHAVSALCIRTTLNGTLHFRALGACRPGEIQIGSFDGTTLRFTGINVQIVSGSGTTDGPVNGKGNLIIGYNENSCAVDRTDCSSDADCQPNPCDLACQVLQG